MKEKCLVCGMEKIYSSVHKCKMCGMSVNYDDAEYFLDFVFCSVKCRDFFKNIMEKSDNKYVIEREILI